MAIKKQEFYEGAAIHRLACTGTLKTISFKNSFFLFNNDISAYFKYSTKNRSPWGFTFTPEEFRSISREAKEREFVIGLICGFDGVAMVFASELLKIGFVKESVTRIACFRKHGAYYRIRGPNGRLERKVPPSDWDRLLDEEDGDQLMLGKL